MASNKLIEERSPYLLQHGMFFEIKSNLGFFKFFIILIYFLKIIQKASNPVYWYPWGEEAFQAAIESNKLIFLSVGYSTCHWCHVMERESFESQEVCMYNFSILRQFFYHRQVI